MKKMFGMNYFDSVNVKQKMIRNFSAGNVAMCLGDSDQTNSVGSFYTKFIFSKYFSPYEITISIVNFQTLMSALIAYMPNRVGFSQFLHYWQMVKTGRFQNFDYGRAENLVHYHQNSPPEYNLKNVIAPVGIYYGQSDLVTVVADTKKLIAELPNVVKEYLIPNRKFNHVDFIFGNDAPTLLYDEIVKTIKSF